MNLAKISAAALIVAALASTGAMAATTTIAQVSHFAELGEIDPETVITPGIFVQRVVKLQPADAAAAAA